MKIIFYFFVLALPLLSVAQNTIHGVVTDEKGEPLVGANVYLKGTYDGATSDANGSFRFETLETGVQVLVISFIGFETRELPVQAARDQSYAVVLKEAFNAMEAVTISAGSFEAGDEKKTVVLNSLDIAMTAGATADITGALNTLPGTQKVGESGQLFVRGGTAEETKVFVDGAEAANYYGATVTGIPARSRFSPFLFKGTFFSTGGYSAEYGQALSSALILNTLDVDQESAVDVSIMSIGVDAAITRAWEQASLFGQVSYMNLTPYYGLINQRYDWHKSPERLDGTLAYKKRLEHGGKFKVLGMVNSSSFEADQKTILNEQGYNSFGVDNRNAFLTSSLELPLGDTDHLYIGGSMAYNKDDREYNASTSRSPGYHQHLKIKYVHEITPQSTLNVGGEFFRHHYDIQLRDSIGTLKLGFTNINPAAFGELDQYLSNSLMVRVGARVAYQSLLHEYKISPRLSMAYRLSDFSQVSLATGFFYQNPSETYLRVTDQLTQEEARHYILNYQHLKDGRIFRIEPYYKQYGNLVTYSDLYDAETFRNDGEGYAYGVDVLWRDRGGIENIDYWVSYSFLQSERKFQDYPEKAQPDFASAHNLSFVIKRFFPVLKTQMGATYSFTSGRPYENPNKAGFNESTTKGYHDLSFNLAYLPTAQVVIYASATNLLGADQVFGYRFAGTPDGAGHYDSEAIRLPSRRFLFIGCFITIGAFNQQLENL